MKLRFVGYEVFNLRQRSADCYCRVENRLTEHTMAIIESLCQVLVTQRTLATVSMMMVSIAALSISVQQFRD